MVMKPPKDQPWTPILSVFTEVGKVPGLIDVKVHIDGRLASSNADVMLDSTLESEEALRGYAQHPAHVAVADGKVRPYTVSRSCLDFEVE